LTHVSMLTVSAVCDCCVESTLCLRWSLLDCVTSWLEEGRAHRWSRGDWETWLGTGTGHSLWSQSLACTA